MTDQTDPPADPPMTPAPGAAERKSAVEAMADADEAWTQALDEGHTPGGTVDELRLASLLAFGSDYGVTIRRSDGALLPADPPMTTRLPDGLSTQP